MAYFLSASKRLGFEVLAEESTARYTVLSLFTVSRMNLYQTKVTLPIASPREATRTFIN